MLPDDEHPLAPEVTLRALVPVVRGNGPSHDAGAGFSSCALLEEPCNVQQHRYPSSTLGRGRVHALGVGVGVGVTVQRTPRCTFAGSCSMRVCVQCLRGFVHRFEASNTRTVQRKAGTREKFRCAETTNQLATNKLH